MSGTETLDTDVVVVGGGPAGLATAIHFRRLITARRRACPDLPDLSVTVIEKASALGAHSLSGAVIDSGAVAALLPERGFPPQAVACRASRLAWLTRSRSLGLPGLGRVGRRHGQLVLSLGRLVGWLAEAAEREGVQLAPGFAGVTALIEDGRVCGVRTGDSGVDRRGLRKSSFSAGGDVRARVTVVAEGARGSLAGQVTRALGAGSSISPAVYGLGFKELWEVPAGRLRAGDVLHTLGFPLDRRTYGGGFVYAHSDREVSVGLVLGLDYRDPRTDPYELFQRFKSHPLLRGILGGGQALGFGARAIDEGGWYGRPQPYGDGWLLVGESAGLLDVWRLKGVHLALESGMLAAETVVEALLANDVSARSLSRYEAGICASSIATDMRRARNVRSAFRWGRECGVALSGLLWMTGGRGWIDPLAPSRGYAEMRPLPLASRSREVQTGAVEVSPTAFPRATALSFSGTRHEEDQPSHLLIADPDVCVTRCAQEYLNPCQRFCPAGVYEIVGSAPPSLVLHAANCLHCKTCEIMDPYQVVTWVPPEGGGGPRYEGL